MRLDAFLTLTSTDHATGGETTDALFTDADPKPIEILWYEQISTRGRYENRGLGMNQQGVTSSRMQVSTLSVLKPLDETSPLLLAAVGHEGDDNGFVYQSAKIETYFYRGDSSQDYTSWTRLPYFVIEMTNVNIMRLQLIGDPRVMTMGAGTAEIFYQLPDDLASMGPVELVDLSFETITWNYKGERVQPSTATSGAQPVPPAPS